MGWLSIKHKSGKIQNNNTRCLNRFIYNCIQRVYLSRCKEKLCVPVYIARYRDDIKSISC